VDRIPENRENRTAKNKENKSQLANKLKSTGDAPLDNPPEVQNENQASNKQRMGGLTYRKLKPEVKMTLEKVVYQLELVAKTLQLLEHRVVDSEDKLQTVMNFIKNSDLAYVS